MFKLSYFLMHCITFAFLQCFMHFRCEFYMLKSCVLVGLDWAEPMMYLLLHVTCSCIRTFKSIYSFIFFVGAFLIVSIFLFLALVYSMAPKCKSTLSQNPLRSGASTSSSNPTPSHVRFRDDKARNDFLENFSQQGIHLEHQVILSDFSNIDLPTVIYSRGWRSLCDIPITCPSVIIQEFYSNMHGFNTSVPHFFSHIRGTRIIVTPDIVYEVLHVPRVAYPNYPSYDHLRTVSKDELSSLFYETPSSWGNR